MLTESELDNLLIAQKDSIIFAIDQIPNYHGRDRMEMAIHYSHFIGILLPLWDACNYHYKAVELMERLNIAATTKFSIPPTTKEGGL
jgi:hypothetical protein